MNFRGRLHDPHALPSNKEPLVPAGWAPDGGEQIAVLTPYSVTTKTWLFYKAKCVLDILIQNNLGSNVKMA
jgi:hypothetical protein